MSKTPVVVFAYNRPDHTRQMLDSLARCYRLNECRVIIFSDGPRTSKDVEKVNEVRKVARFWASAYHAEIVERSENYGLARSVVDGVTHLCDTDGKVIVLEDDLIVHPGFLDYMLQSLTRYQDNERVGQISGYMFPVQYLSASDCFFLPTTTTWGWATWKRAWSLFNWHPSFALERLADLQVRSKFNLNNAYPYASMLEDRLLNKNQSWGILFYWACFSAEKIVLHPKKTLVRNIGFDGSGYHFDQPSTRFLHEEFEAWDYTRKIEFPEFSEVDQSALESFCTYLNDSGQKESQVKKIVQVLKHVGRKWLVKIKNAFL